MKRFVNILLIALMTGCKTTQPITQTRDSVRVQYRLDSVYVWQHDSIFRDRWRNGDTVFVTVEKWQVKWRDRLETVHDTVVIKDTQTVEVPYVPEYYKNTSRGFWVLLAALIVIVGWKIAKVYFRLKI